MSNLQKIVVLCIVGCIILVGGFFVLSSNIYNEKQADEETEIILEEAEEEIDISDWQTYRSEEIEFQYPRNWLIDEKSTGGANPFLDIHLNNFGHSDSPACDNGFIGLEIQVGHSKDPNQAFDLFVESQLGSGLGSPSGKIENFQVDGHSVFKAENSGWDSGCSGPGYLLEQNQGHYVYVFTGADDAEDQVLFDQIISTFRFIEPIDTSDWQIYRNEEFGFEVRYPTVFLFAPQPNPEIFTPVLRSFSEIGVDGSPLSEIRIAVYDMKILPQQNAQDYLNSLPSHFQKAGPYERSIGGLKVYATEDQPTNTSWWSFSRRYYFSDFVFAFNYATSKAVEDFQDIENQILSTFRFVGEINISRDKEVIEDAKGGRILHIDAIKKTIEDFRLTNEEYIISELEPLLFSKIILSPDKTKVAILASEKPPYSGFSLIFDVQTKNIIFLDPDVNYAPSWPTFPRLWSPDSKFILVHAVGFEHESSEVIFDVVEQKRVTSIFNNLNSKEIVGWSSNESIDYIEDGVRWRFNINTGGAVRVDSN